MLKKATKIYIKTKQQKYLLCIWVVIIKMLQVFVLFFQKFTYETYVLGQEIKFDLFFLIKDFNKNLLNTRN